MNEWKGIVEGLLFASGEDGITIKQLARILELHTSTIEQLLEELSNEYKQTGRGMMMMQSHRAFHLTTKPQHSEYFKKLLETPSSSRMSQAALETLAIIAYQQPITRTEIDDIRGVKSDRPIQTLLSRELIEELGRRDGVGRPVLFGTSKEFLTSFGLTSLDELPPLPEEVDQNTIEQEADLFFESFNRDTDNDLE